MDASGDGKQSTDKVDSDAQALTAADALSALPLSAVEPTGGADKTGGLSFPSTPPAPPQAPAPGATSPAASDLLARSAGHLLEDKGKGVVEKDQVDTHTEPRDEFPLNDFLNGPGGVDDLLMERRSELGNFSYYVNNDAAAVDARSSSASAFAATGNLDSRVAIMDRHKLDPTSLPGTGNTWTSLRLDSGILDDRRWQVVLNLNPDESGFSLIEVPRGAAAGDEGELQEHSAASSSRGGAQPQNPNLAGQLVERNVILEEAEIIHVWEDGLDEAFQELGQALTTGTEWVLAMDTEFCASDAPKPEWTPPMSPEEHYEWAQRYVNNGYLVQIGLALASPKFVLKSNRVYEFNLRLDPATSTADRKGLKFLRDKAKFDLEEHSRSGIPAQSFMEKFKASGLLGNDSITWLTFQGYADYGYIVTGFEGVPTLPADRMEYLTSVRRLIPKSYDLKLLFELGLWCPKAESGSAGLADLGLVLGAKRIGTAHHAGSDAHLTLQCFKLIVTRRNDFIPLKIMEDSLYGVSDVPLIQPGIFDANITTLHVWGSNFQKLKGVFTSLFPLFGYVFVDVKLENHAPGNLPLELYEAVRSEVAGAGNLEVTVVVSDHRGWVALQKIWVFHIGENNKRISPGMFAELLTSGGLIGVQGLYWVASRSGGAFLYLVNLLTVASLPALHHSFLHLCSGFFPCFDVAADVEDTTWLSVLRMLRRYLTEFKVGDRLLRRKSIWDLRV